MIRDVHPGVFEVWLHLMLYFSRVLIETKLKTCFCTVIIHFGFKSTCISGGTNSLDLFLILVGAPYVNTHIQIRPTGHCGS